MKTLLFFISIFMGLGAFAQTSSGINWDRYYITGSLTVGQGIKNAWANDALLLQVGRDTNTRGMKISWVIDTANVIFPRPFGTIVGQLKDSSYYTWVGSKWKGLVSSSSSPTTDTSSLSDRINHRVRYIDTASMLAPYATDAQLSDTASALRVAITSGSANAVKYSDTASMLAPYATKGNLKDTATVLRGLITSSIVDTSSLSTRINQRVKYTDTAAMLASYATKSKVAADSLALANAMNQRVRYTDTGAMLTPYATDGSVSDTAAAIRGVVVTKAPLASPTFTGSVTVDFITGKQYGGVIQTLTDASTTTWNANNGCQAIWTIGGTGRTLAISNPVTGSFYTLKLIQGSGGSKTVTTWPTGTKWSGGDAPVLSTAAGAVDIVSFWYDGTNFNANFSLDVQ